MNAEKKQDKPKKQKVRVNQSGKKIPETAQLLICHFEQLCKEAGFKSAQFTLNEIPLSLNHQKKHVVFRSRISGKMVRGEALKSDVRRFRATANGAITKAMSGFSSRGTCAAIILFESSRWLTKELTVRIEDCDNKVKPIFDAVQESFQEFRDETVWEFHAYKMMGKKDAVHIWIFDLGDIVDIY